MRDKFFRKLSAIPAPGGGGCHAALLGAANLGARTEFSPSDVFRLIKASIPPGTRKVPDSEIWDAVHKAFADVKQNTWIKSTANTTIKKIDLVEHCPETETDILLEISPLKIPENPTAHSRYLLENLYAPADRLFIGEKFSNSVRLASEWLNDSQLTLNPLIIPNPLTGKAGLTKDGKNSFRSDSCVAKFRFVVAEFDNVSIQKQTGFWLHLLNEGLPIAAIIHSGGKSLHAWIAVDCQDTAEWEREVEGNLFPNFLVPMGIDGACKNEARMSRFPGHLRKEKEEYQKLLYLNPEASHE